MLFSVRDNGRGKPDPDQVTQTVEFQGTFPEWLDEETLDFLSAFFEDDVREWPLNCETVVLIFNEVLGAAPFLPEHYNAIEGGSINVH